MTAGTAEQGLDQAVPLETAPSRFPVQAFDAPWSPGRYDSAHTILRYLGTELVPCFTTPFTLDNAPIKSTQ